MIAQERTGKRLEKLNTHTHTHSCSFVLVLSPATIYLYSSCCINWFFSPAESRHFL